MFPRFEYVKNVVPDSKGRIVLGKETEGVSSYKVFYNPEEKTYCLEPQVEIPQRELWLYKNKKALESVERGIEDAKAGRLKTIEEF